MTLGAQGGAVKPLTRTELIKLAETSPTTNLVMLGRALGVSEPVIRERARRGELAALGIRVNRLGAQWRVITADILAYLGITRETGTAGPAPAGAPDGGRNLRILQRGGGDGDEAA
ncbi:MAG: hypothetical protein ACLPKE_34850 [Streptosporangiaceae bacterium]